MDMCQAELRTDFQRASAGSQEKKLREEGKAAIYIEQNHRPQLLYTEEDRELMEEAWALTTAHREDLAGRLGNPR